MNVSKHLYEEKLSLEGQQRPKLKVIFKQGIRPWVKEERGKLIYEFVKSILQTSVRYRCGQSFGKDKGYKFTLIQPDGRQFIALVGITITSISVGIFKRSANPVPHEFYISLGGLLGSFKIFGKKFGIGMFITLDLLVEPIVSFVSKFSSHDILQMTGF